MKLQRQQAKRLTIPKALVQQVNAKAKAVRLQKTPAGLSISFTGKTNLQLTHSGSIEIRPSWLPAGQKLQVTVVGKSLLVTK